MNTFIALSALLAVAAAAPEADPQFVLGLVSPHAKTAELVTHANGAVVPSDTVSVQAARAGHLAYKGLYGYYGHPYVHYLGKREAESNPDADPYYLLHGYHYKPVITSVGAFTTYSNGAVTPTNTPSVQAATANHLAAKAGIYAARGYYGHPYGHFLGKREAEAEADPWYYYGHYPAVTSVGGLTTYSNGAVVPTHHANLAATAAHLATKAVYPYGLYHHLGKREAEAEADPYYFYHHYPAVTSVGGLTTYSNGAVVPTDPANLAATAAHLATKATYPYGYYGYLHGGYLGGYYG